MDINKIAVFGPHDRMNYGDFLFPIMLDFAFSKCLGKEIVLKKYSLVKSDFTNIGAFKSFDYHQLKKDIEKGLIETVIVAGGECLGAKWSNLYSYINPIYNFFYQKPKFKNNDLFNLLPRKLLGGKSENPFIINKFDFPGLKHIIYNSVGGGAYLNSNQLDNLAHATICGLREKLSYDIITKHNINASLVPDSAIIISDVYPKSSLIRLVEEDYLFFQISNFKHQNSLSKVASQLLEICDIYKIKIVLCPIGTAGGHDDHIALRKVYELCNCENVILYTENPKLSDILSLIVYSKLYIGTSLHGVITAMSYGIPYIALNPSQTKICAYLKTWSIEELVEVLNVDSFIDKIDKLCFTDDLKQKMKVKLEIQKKIYYNFFDNIFTELKKII